MTTYHAEARPARTNFVIRPRDFQLQLGIETKIMGILNLSPDSFSGDGRLSNGKTDIKKNVEYAQKLIAQGADIIDVGGESTHPGARRISIKEEIDRIIPTIRSLAKKVNVPISVDTYKATVAKYALDAGASIINDIMGTDVEKGILKMVKKYEAAIVLMHIRGTPRTMQQNISYDNLIQEIMRALQKSIEKCLENGIKSDKIIIDPGIGFGKTVEHNLEIINRLSDFSSLNQPLLMGASRKSFIGKVLDKDIEDRLIGTIVTVCASVLNGSHIVRVHDVGKIKESLIMLDTIMNSSAFRKS